MIKNYFELNPLRKKLRDSFDKLNDTIQEYDKINPVDYVNDFFAHLKYKVDLHRCDLIKEINERAEKILNELKEKEDKCKSKRANIFEKCQRYTASYTNLTAIFKLLSRQVF